MSKETTLGTICRCGNLIYYHAEHWRVCPERDTWKPKKKKESGDAGRKSSRKRGKPSRAESTSAD